MPRELDYFHVLGLKKGASDEEVTAAYLELVNSTTNAAKLEAIEEAYAALMDTAPVLATGKDAAAAPRAGEPSPSVEEAPWEDGDDVAEEEQAAEELDNEGWEDRQRKQPAATPKNPPLARARTEVKAPAASPPTGEGFDPYRALNLTPKASQQQIKTSYDRLLATTKRKARVAEIERAYQMLSGQPVKVTAAAARRPANPRRSQAGSAPHPRQDAFYGYDDSRPTTRAKARREQQLALTAGRRRATAHADEDPYRRYLYLGFGALVVVVILGLVFAGLGGAFNRGPADYSTLVQRGNNAYDSKDWASAEKWYSQALAINGGDTNVRTDYGASLFYQDKYDQAIAQYQAVLVVEPNKYQTLLNLGLALTSKTPPDVDGAVAAWQKVIDTSSDSAAVQQARDYIAKYKQ